MGGFKRSTGSGSVTDVFVLKLEVLDLSRNQFQGHISQVGVVSDYDLSQPQPSGYDLFLITKQEEDLYRLSHNLLVVLEKYGVTEIFIDLQIEFIESSAKRGALYALMTFFVLHDGAKELAQNDLNSAKYVISDESKDIGEKLSEIGSRLDYPHLTKDLAKEIETLWEDAAIQETYARGNELQVPDCTKYFMENLQRLSDANYVPTKEDVLYARVRTTGVVEIQFSTVGENKRSGEVYRLFDVPD
ncbi:Guanine nucleotide-binding protein alpha-2 subunit [Lathyrus oleraceus]|uniref:Guanine nucleotide-binding protein alpha subunit n=1 Tax=Pisum sativum TaxID=3888 RepID=A0A9D4YFA2_PEA|nr:Guanine nucleotide-binding protein alpha-2 subunit [Pisum sativum]